VSMRVSDLTDKIERLAREQAPHPPEWYSALRNAAQWLRWAECIESRATAPPPPENPQEGLFDHAVR
jgi:hypothetical protein